jgi:predicted TIM-barrel fold metal-dependent hydrolase
LDFFGFENVVFASDAPFGPVAETRDGVSRLDTETTHLDAIFHGNTERLVKMQVK